MNNVHKDHRKRLKNLYIKNGLDSFYEHNILELLLFFGIPYKDTNVIAHELLDKYGSFSAVFDADIDSLKEVKNMTENAAVLIKLLPDIARLYYTSDAAKEGVFDSYGKIEDYLLKKYIGTTKENVCILMFDDKNHLIVCEKLDIGKFSVSEIDLAEIIKIIHKTNLKKVIIAHNHPDGSAVSSSDIVSAKWLGLRFSELGINLYECYVISNKKAIGILDMLKSRPAWV